ncbi:MAG: DtxR family iron (metal) dependent repressor [Chloroflexi bacterium]|nr:DtxR family iron (metal) dependent repressor [Chloroflexota bacterium]MBT7079917.1 DtxR family iron (metal) dependent repressor [Chloroflexota bacterium]MBT7290109.1 DtxR family iron (metal) dependent repressor [Chloroflexota bacterium]
MQLEENTEELLETLWIRQKEKKSLPSVEELADNKPILDKLLDEGYVSVADNKVSLTKKGLPEAKSVIRRHRLAERLLYDVLGTSDMLLHDKACKFEHLLDRGLDESICILLGHPKVCPHGKAIPAGNCCKQQKTQAQKVVYPLSQLSSGQHGKVAYIHAPETGQLQKLMSMGVLPGEPIKLVQSFPSYVFEVRHSQFAADDDIAQAIYVRLPGQEELVGKEETSTSETNASPKKRGLWNTLLRRD